MSLNCRLSAAWNGDTAPLFGVAMSGSAVQAMKFEGGLGQNLGLGQHATERRQPSVIMSGFATQIKVLRVRVRVRFWVSSGLELELAIGQTSAVV